MAKEKKQDKESSAQGRSRPDCPFCALADAMDQTKGRHQEFFGHLRNAEAEFLKAMRSLIDDRLEKCAKEPKKATKIKVD